MHDQHIYLDASFDQHARYTLIAWLRPRDAYVNIGESIAIIQDGDMRRVVTAPCSGRIVAVYADAGAPLLPRSLLAAIRPGLPYAPQITNIGTTIIAVALIGATIVLLPLLRGMLDLTRDDTNPTIPTLVATPSQPTQSSVATMTPSASESIVTDTPVSDTGNDGSQPLPTSPSNKVLISKINTLFIELANLCNEIRPWTQRNTLIDTQIVDNVITIRNDRRMQIVDELRMIVADNSPLVDVNSGDDELLSQIELYIEPCSMIYDEVMNAHAQSIVPRDLSAEYDRCNAAQATIQQYFYQP
ncbi:MAG: hypothetical protein ACKO83_03945 [Roseiflexaceae bacterium]